MDVKKRKATVPRMMMMMFFLVLSANCPGCFSASSQQSNKKKSTHPKSVKGFGSSVLFPLTGNVYPLGYYSISLIIGHPPKVFEFDIDTGSDLTWVQCDAPCTGCAEPIDHLYKLEKHILVPCEHPSCYAVHFPESPRCETPDDQWTSRSTMLIMVQFLVWWSLTSFPLDLSMLSYSSPFDFPMCL